LVLGLSAAAQAQSLRPIPALTGPIVDEAGLLDPADRARLEELARAVRAQDQGQGVQLQFLLVSGLQGEPIEDFSIRVAEAWKVGTKGKDNGLLFVVSRDDRRARIEVGGGLEGGLTDSQAGRIIRDVLAPAFRAGRYGAGLEAAAVQALAALGMLPSDRRPQRLPSGALSGPVALLLILPLLLLSIFGRKRRYWYGGGPWLGGGWGGGGWSGGRGGFGGGGGGWGGGGGGFSGGGASGSW
jgi:uncharacterized protein